MNLHNSSCFQPFSDFEFVNLCNSSMFSVFLRFNIITGHAHNVTGTCVLLPPLSQQFNGGSIPCTAQPLRSPNLFRPGNVKFTPVTPPLLATNSLLSHSLPVTFIQLSLCSLLVQPTHKHSRAPEEMESPIPKVVHYSKRDHSSEDKASLSHHPSPYMSSPLVPDLSTLSPTREPMG